MSDVSRFLQMRLGYGLRNGSFAILGLALLSSAWALSSSGSKKPLRIFFVDVEGGQATLFVTPDQHALLIDTGWNGNKRTGCRPHCCRCRESGDPQDR